MMCGAAAQRSRSRGRPCGRSSRRRPRRPMRCGRTTSCSKCWRRPLAGAPPPPVLWGLQSHTCNHLATAPPPPGGVDRGFLAFLPPPLLGKASLAHGICLYSSTLTHTENLWANRPGMGGNEGLGWPGRPGRPGMGGWGGQ